MPPRHLYVHVPFCARRCAYCDFSIAVRRVTPVAAYLAAIRTELEMIVREAAFTSSTEWQLDTLYLGGGTPSRLGAGIPELLGAVRDVATITAAAEVTIEANPEDVTPENADLWRQAGVNRISLGAQSFDPAVLAWMHRVHSSDQIADAVRVARDAGFENISLDLIFALPASLRREWKRDLHKAVALAPAHISVYGLTVEPQTPLARWRDRGEVNEAGEDSYATEFLEAHDTLTAAGYEHYEVSNFAQRGRHSRHNSAYWSGAAYTGIGPSAHSFDGARRWWNVGAYARWVAHLANGESPIADVEVLHEENLFNEKVYLGLRTKGGVLVDGNDVVDLQPWVDAGWARISKPEACDVVTPASTSVAARTRMPVEHSAVTLTPNGWLLLDELAASLTSVRSRSYV